MVVAAGVAPNTGFLDGSGIAVDVGIKVDNHMRTSVADIYGAGDVVQALDRSTGEYSVLAIQPTACRAWPDRSPQYGRQGDAP